MGMETRTLVEALLIGAGVGVMIGSCVVGIINSRKDAKDREKERVRHEATMGMLSKLETEFFDMKKRYDKLFAEVSIEPAAFEKDFIRRCRIEYKAMADRAKVDAAKERGYIE